MINIFICDDHNIILEGLTAMLKDEPNIHVVASSSNPINCLQLLSVKKVDVLLTDISMPEMDGIELCKKVKQLYPNIQVLALSTYNQGKIILSMMDAGASGYVLKNADKKEILEAIQTVYEGKEYMGFELSKIYHVAKEEKERKPIITKREKEVLQLIVNGMSNMQISQQLFISIDTVDTHRKNVYTKLGVNNVASLLKYVNENAVF
jgi:DNA-binding NarL/FixJ family response regulator